MGKAQNGTFRKKKEIFYCELKEKEWGVQQGV